MQYKMLKKYFQFELHTSESQNCSIQASQRLVSKRLHIEKQFQIERQKKKNKKRNTLYNIHWRIKISTIECLLSICYWEHIEF